LIRRPNLALARARDGTVARVHPPTVPPPTHKGDKNKAAIRDRACLCQERDKSALRTVTM